MALESGNSGRNCLRLDELTPAIRTTQPLQELPDLTVACCLADAGLSVLYFTGNYRRIVSGAWNMKQNESSSVKLDSRDRVSAM